jgi:galactonate dehydratase
MKITDLKVHVVNADWRDWVFVKLITDEGLTGVGEASLSGSERQVVAALEGIKTYLLGKNPLHIENHWRALYQGSTWRTAVLLSALGGVEQAMWDILGKVCDLPVYALLGGPCRDRVRCYTHISEEASGHSVDERVDEALAAVSEGWTALKWDPIPANFHSLSPSDLRSIVEQLGAVREAVGDDIDLLVEAHGRLDPGAAITMAREIAPFKPYFLEEPVPPECLDGLAKVANQAPVPLATGERITTAHAYWPLLEQHLVDFIQPDVIHVGGLLACKKIAALAEARYVRVAPHNPNGPVATAAALHLAANLPNLSILEIPGDDYAWSARWRDDLLVDPRPVTVRDGYLDLPVGPGLGVDLDEQAIARHPSRPRQWTVSFRAENAISS